MEVTQEGAGVHPRPQLVQVFTEAALSKTKLRHLPLFLPFHLVGLLPQPQTSLSTLQCALNVKAVLQLLTKETELTKKDTLSLSSF